MKFNEVPAGTYTVGSPLDEEGRFGDEVQKEVTLTSFEIKTTPVTQEEYEAVMGTNPSYFTGECNPVERVSWFDALAYCNALSESEGLAPYYQIEGDPQDPDRVLESEPGDPGYYSYRLATEEEWEVACRAESTGPRYDDPEGNMYPLDDIAWYWGSGTTHPVAQKAPNKWGLYDMLGNTWEWCSTRYEI